MTNKCIFRCLHCYNSSGENIVIDDELADDEVVEFIKDVAKMQLYNVCFCGGEPLLRKELIYKCTKILKDNGTTYVSMVTNGFLIDKKTALNLKKSGMDNIQISLDGATSATHDKLRNKRGAFSRAINAIDTIKSVGFKNVDVAFCPTSFNIDEFESLHDLLSKMNIRELRVQPLMLLGRANHYIREIEPSDFQYRQLVKTIFDLTIKGKEPVIQWGDPIDHLIRFRTITKDCITFVSIKANGDIEVSPYLPIVVGNIRKHNFSEYWNAGLAHIWQMRIIQNIAKTIMSISDMNKRKNNLPIVWLEKDIYIDLIEDISRRE
ncbi:radical SAM protein [Thermoanaerobacterium thermosaccharolyticum]